MSPSRSSVSGSSSAITTFATIMLSDESSGLLRSRVADRFIVLTPFETGDAKPRMCVPSEACGSERAPVGNDPEPEDPWRHNPTPAEGWIVCVLIGDRGVPEPPRGVLNDLGVFLIVG